MKNTKLHAIVLVSLAMIGSNLIDPALALAGGDKCVDLCQQYHAGVINGQDSSNMGSTNQLPMSLAYLKASSCGAMPVATPTGTPNSAPVATSDTSDSSRGVDPTTCAVPTCDSKWDLCFHALQAEWGQFAQHCQAIDADNAGHDAEEAALIGYAVSAGVCAAACIAEKSGVGSWTKGVCMVGGLAAIVVDLGETIDVRSKTSGSVGDWGETVGAMVFAGVGEAAQAAVSLSAKKAAEKVGNDSCAAAALTALSAVLKGLGMGDDSGLADSECQKLQSFVSASPLPSMVADDTSPGPGPSAVPTSTSYGAAGSSGQGAQGGSSGVKGGAVRPLPASVQTAVRDFPNGVHYAASTAGDVFQPLYNKIDGKENMGAVLQQATGMSIGDLAKKLNSGQSLSQAFSGIQGMEGASAAFAQVEKDVKDGVITAKGGGPLTSGLMTAGGGVKGAAKPAAVNPFGNFGMKGPGSGGSPAETTFEKAKRELAASEGSGDIWHEGFGGTIFQIVSSKLDKTRDRIDQLEWDTPLNRALVGLPSRKK